MTDANGPDTGAGEASSTGLDPNIAGVLCYLLGFITGIVFLVIEQKSRDVRFHAYQSLGTFLPLFVLSVVASVVPLIGWIVSVIVGPLSLVLWIVLMVKAFQGERFELPIVGPMADERSRAPA